MQLPVKMKGIHEIEKYHSISISVFGYENKVKYSMSKNFKKCFKEKHVDLLLIEEEGKIN